MRALAIALAISALSHPPAHTQVLDDWIMMHSGTSFDYLVTERGLGILDSAGVLRRVTVSRMLVRHPDGARTRIIEERESAGAVTAGYADYISSTYILNNILSTKIVAPESDATERNSDGQPSSRGHTVCIQAPKVGEEPTDPSSKPNHLP